MKFDKIELAKKRWVLKCPENLASLDVLVKEFPDAKIIWNHRDMNQSIDPLQSLPWSGKLLFLDECIYLVCMQFLLLSHIGNIFFHASNLYGLCIFKII